ncbi:hypothetical protein FE784_15300 [Paenibacillus hemerocallicola]|uniref:Pectate lyase superfamily protein domain-containing protein n=1 Tax=Paenibacillus hemerocallicola TaxID=1172614 RepID=A0A5C4T9J5_9BACL|nr:hypothetical protein [Paenibacillus hemerocallicola]TNJ65386.1 hypothetical protein FE784_15300 [Paenibacillus hemerocallicola]
MVDLNDSNESMSRRKMLASMGVAGAAVLLYGASPGVVEGVGGSVMNSVYGNGQLGNLFRARGVFRPQVSIKHEWDILEFTSADGLTTGYRWAGALPYTTTANNPAADGGVGDAGWVAVYQIGLAAALAESGGVALVGGAKPSWRVADSAMWPSDPTAALKAVLAMASATGGQVLIPAGTYSFTATGGNIELPPNVVVSGEGVGVTSLVWNGAGHLFRYWRNSATWSGAVGTSHAIADMSINGGSNPDSIAVEISDTYGFKLRNVSFYGFTAGDGLVLHSRNYWVEGTTLENVSISNCKRHIVFKRQPGTASMDSFGYTTFRNVSLNVRDDQIGILVGDDAYNDAQHEVYNAILEVNIWKTGSSIGVAFGKNGAIRDSSGIFRCEQPPEGQSFTGTFIQIQHPETSGFFNFDGPVRTSHLNHAENWKNTWRDLRYQKLRDIGEPKPGVQNYAQWFRVCRIGEDKSLFSGRVRMVTDYGKASYRSASAEFAFGARGKEVGGMKPVFTVDGDGFNGTTDAYAKFAVYADAEGKHWLYFRRPKYTNYCVFEYTYDMYPQGTFEYWDKTDSPESEPSLTKVWDSVSYPSQASYIGDEIVFTGQRAIATANGGNASYQVAHQLGVAPEWYMATALSADANSIGISSVTADAGNIVIAFKSATPAGTGNIRFAVEWGRKQFNNRFRPT